MSTNLTQATVVAMQIANICNNAANLAASAPYAEFASMLIELDPVDRNEACYTVLLETEAKAWNIAKTGIRNALKARGHDFGESGPDHRKRAERKVPFTIVTKAEKESAKREAEQLAEEQQKTLRAQAIEREQLKKLEDDKQITEDTLVSVLLSECARLGLDSRKAATLLAGSLELAVVSTVELETLRAAATPKTTKRNTATVG